MPKYPSNLNGPSLTVDNVTNRWELKDTTTNGLANTSGNTETWGDMFLSLVKLQQELTLMLKLMLVPKENVRVATTAALPSTAAIVYSNGTAGVGATLTRGENGALGTIDGVTLAVGDRILVKNQAAAAQNGIYIVTDLGSGGAPYVLTRAQDADQANANEVAQGLMVIVNEGTANATKPFVLTQSAAITMGTTALTFAEFDGESDLPTAKGNLVAREVDYISKHMVRPMNHIRNQAVALWHDLNRLKADIDVFTASSGDQVPADGRYPSGWNRGW